VSLLCAWKKWDQQQVKKDNATIHDAMSGLRWHDWLSRRAQDKDKAEANDNHRSSESVVSAPTRSSSCPNLSL
ncbi:MAG: hypothetical protein KDH94_03975, partial [Coxiellaceae bacterium]|nr:hypothetical protein [Coxiellaceae bacterium]